MGIKNIHIVLIGASICMALLLGFWCLNNDYQMISGISLFLAVGLMVYGINFLKKMKTL